MKITDVVIVADCSASMGHLETKQQDAIWAALQELSRAEAEGQAYAVSIVKFGSIVENATPFKAASSYTRDELSTVRANMQNTALLDAIGHAATILGNRKLVEGQKLLTVA